MEKSDVIEALIENARENGAKDAVVVDVPPEVLRDAGATYTEEEGNDDGARVKTTLVAGPVAEEDEERITLRTPSRVGTKDDFSSEVRKKLRPGGVYGFRDDNLDGVSLPKDDVTVHRVEEESNQ
jgi:predicted methyltransferase